MSEPKPIYDIGAMAMTAEEAEAFHRLQTAGYPALLVEHLDLAVRVKHLEARLTELEKHQVSELEQFDNEQIAAYATRKLAELECG